MGLLGHGCTLRYDDHDFLAAARACLHTTLCYERKNYGRERGLIFFFFFSLLLLRFGFRSLLAPGSFASCLHQIALHPGFGRSEARR